MNPFSPGSSFPRRGIHFRWVGYRLAAPSPLVVASHPPPLLGCELGSDHHNTDIYIQNCVVITRSDLDQKPSVPGWSVPVKNTKSMEPSSYSYHLRAAGSETTGPRYEVIAK
ncbi:hypothetical protein FOTG_09142 [Fusarium oxysporum f. sp. vasinfectum 25433]|jgi:hypothetical protein|uniref:Uncharacterized protein n=1 Tax=Fusarium oxysporum f. sp. vasinfectum 25433 TaxID=1089449 RepID=X0LD62_FUSOX|nr:hypothetical protein FOTG_09142 [Fusarium oxysporum f. sp. vasinfectum 25433]